MNLFANLYYNKNTLQGCEAEWFTWIICSNAIGDPLLLWLSLCLSLLVATMVGSMVADVLYMYA